MPYAEVKDLPPRLNKYSLKVKRQFMHVFNTVYDKTNSEGRAFQAANSVLKKRFLKGKNTSKESQSDFINCLIDSWLGNLHG